MIHFVTKCVLQDPRLIIQKVVDLAQVAYADFEPRGCNRVIRKELVGQSKLKDLLGEVYGSDSVLTEGQVPINIDLNGRYDLFVDDVVVVELKNEAPEKSWDSDQRVHVQAKMSSWSAHQLPQRWRDIHLCNALHL